LRLIDVVFLQRLLLDQYLERVFICRHEVHISPPTAATGEEHTAEKKKKKKEKKPHPHIPTTH
jgi:hypothetical protein